MQNTDRVLMRLNAGPFDQYMQSQLELYGSIRALARRARVSHTTLRRLQNGRDKMTVNVTTAQRIETAFGCPPGIIFLPTLLPAASHTSQPDQVPAA